MPKYIIRVTETVNHDYLIEASSEDDALSIYYSYGENELAELDLDGQGEWDAHPWDVEEREEY